MTGDEFHVVDTEAKARQIAEFRLAKERLEQQAKAEAERLAIVAEQRAAGAAAKAARESGDEEKEKVKRVRAGTITDATEEEALTGPKLVPAILRADSAGSLEAVKESLSHFPTDRVQLQVVRADVTAQLSEADIHLAETVGALRADLDLIWENVRVRPTRLYDPLVHPASERATPPRLHTRAAEVVAGAPNLHARAAELPRARLLVR